MIKKIIELIIWKVEQSGIQSLLQVPTFYKEELIGILLTLSENKKEDIVKKCQGIFNLK